MGTDQLPAFCHIGDHGTFGYHGLHRLIAMSDPLILWSPSSLVLHESNSLVGSKELLSYIDDGIVRIAGREEWLNSRGFRDNHPFEGARWKPDFDGVLKRWAELDNGKPVNERRVVACPPATGGEKARTYLEENPGEIDRILRIAESARADERIPQEVLSVSSQLASRHRGGKADRERVRIIVGAAYNHGEAFREVGARYPILLKSVDRKFLTIIRAASAGDAQGEKGRRVAQRRAEYSREALTQQTLELLRVLDCAAAGRTSSRNYERFVTGEGRRELVSWLADWQERLVREGGKLAEDEVLTELRSGLNRGTFSNPWWDAIRLRATNVVGLAGFVSAVAGFAIAPQDPWAGIGVGAAAFPIGKAALQTLGYVSSSFTGPNWPFMYVNGSSVTANSLRVINRVLDVAAED
jgi:hypothetical protein